MITVEKSLFIYESIKYCIRGFNSSVKKKGEKTGRRITLQTTNNLCNVWSRRSLLATSVCTAWKKATIKKLKLI